MPEDRATPDRAASDRATPDRATPDQAAPAAPRQTLAMRLAERSRQREQRAERLARLRPAWAGAAAGAAEAADAAAAKAADAAAPADDDAEAALEEFLRALTGGGQPAAPAAPAEPAAVLHFQRPEAVAAGPTDLDRLPGAGPGLVRALERAGLARLADVAPLAPEDLAARLGPLGRLVPAAAWIDAAREAAAPT